MADYAILFSPSSSHVFYASRYMYAITMSLWTLAWIRREQQNSACIDFQKLKCFTCAQRILQSFIHDHGAFGVYALSCIHPIWHSVSLDSKSAVAITKKSHKFLTISKILRPKTVWCTQHTHTHKDFMVNTAVGVKMVLIFDEFVFYTSSTSSSIRAKNAQKIPLS